MAVCGAVRLPCVTGERASHLMAKQVDRLKRALFGDTSAQPASAPLSREGCEACVNAGGDIADAACELAVTCINCLYVSVHTQPTPPASSM
jgi:hypothetical protein